MSRKCRKQLELITILVPYEFVKIQKHCIKFENKHTHESWFMKENQEADQFRIAQVRARAQSPPAPEGLKKRDPRS